MSLVKQSYQTNVMWNKIVQCWEMYGGTYEWTDASEWVSIAGCISVWVSSEVKGGQW